MCRNCKLSMVSLGCFLCEHKLCWTKFKLIEMYCLSSGHYTDTWTTETAQNLDHPIWSSEDYSHVDDENGAGCLARVRYILILIFFK